MSTLPEEPDSVDPIDEELVAYLDDELPDDRRAAVESRLALDDAYRTRLQSLRAAWDALDVLPESKPDDDFTRKSVEMASLTLAEERTKTVELARRTSWWVRGKWRLAALAGGVAAFALTLLAVTRNERRFIDDLPTIQRVDELLATPSVEFLEKLAAEGIVFEDETSLADGPLGSLGALSPLDPIARRERVVALPADGKRELNAKREKFEALSEDQRQSLRTLSRRIDVSPDAETLSSTMRHYHAWLKTLGETELSELRMAATDASRIERIQTVLKRQRDRDIVEKAERLSKDDSAVVYRWALALAKTHREEIVRQFVERAPEAPGSPGRGGPGRLLAVINSGDSAVADQALLLAYMFRVGFVRERDPETFAKLAPPANEIERLLAAVSPEAKRQFAADMSESERNALLFAWVGSAMVAQGGGLWSPEQTRDALARLPEEQQRALSELPYEEQRRALMFREFHQRVNGGEMPPAFPPGGGPWGMFPRLWRGRYAPPKGKDAGERKPNEKSKRPATRKKQESDASSEPAAPQGSSTK